MGRQFRFFLLPTDVERVASELRERFGACFVQDASPSPIPIEAETLLRNWNGTTSVYCYFTMAENAVIKTCYAEKRQEWLIDSDSEVVQFSGCDFDETVLREGRFYYQTNFVAGNAFCDKSPTFVRWAEQVFRATKKMLTYSQAMSAYIGEDAMRWHAKAGRFAYLRAHRGATAP